MVKVCVVGAGAIGGLVGVRLATTGQCEISAIARGPNLKALRSDGWYLRSEGTVTRVRATFTDDPRRLGKQDVVIIAVKGCSLPEIASNMPALIGPGTIVVPMMNGVPWWFRESLSSAMPAALESADPHGAMAAAIPLRHVVGCVVHASAVVPRPGHVIHEQGRTLIIGEPDGRQTERLGRLHALLTSAEFDVPVSVQIQKDVWYKLWGNLTMNPVSALTGATADRILDDPLVRELCSSAMREIAAIGERIGCAIEQNPDDRHAVTRALGAFKSSMLQDVDSHKMLELDSIVGAVREIGRHVQVATPYIDVIFGMTRVFAQVRGLYP